MRQYLPKLFAPTLVIISLLMHLNYFNRELTGFHVWRQTQTQSTLISFYEEDMNILNPKRNERGNSEGIFRMEFPLMQWTGAAIYQLAGPNLLWIRIMMFVVGLISVWGMYRLVLALFGSKLAAIVAAWTFNFSPTFYYYTVNPMPDNLALCFAIWALVKFVDFQRNQSQSNLWVSGLFLALATLCKLPFVLFYAAPITYALLIFWRERSFINTQRLIIPILSFFPFALAWYTWVIPGWHNTEVTKGMFVNTESILTILNFLQGNLISTLPELLVNYAAFPFFIIGCYKIYTYPTKTNKTFMPLAVTGGAVLCYFLFEINMIGTMHDYYLFPFLPLLFIIVALGFTQLYHAKKHIRIIAILLVLSTPITAHLRIANRWNTESVGFNKDLLDNKEALQTAVPDEALCIVGNDESHFINFYFIHKKGWGYAENNLSAETMHQWIVKGATYWYNDSRELETPERLVLTDSLVGEYGTIRVYKLKTKY
jgi:hypothetical protein